MSQSKPIFVKVGLLTALVLATVAGGDARATMLTFDLTPSPGDSGFAWLYSPNPGPGYDDVSAYGDRVTDATHPIVGSYAFSYGTTGGPTPNVVADYPDYGTYQYVASDTGATHPLEFIPTADNALHHVIVLTADSGYFVTLQSFDISTYLNGTYTAAQITVLDASTSTVLGTLTSTSVAGETTYTISSFTGSQPWTAQAIELDFQAGSVTQNYFGFDNITFSQEVSPEPASLGLLAIGGVMLLRRRRA